MPARKVFLLGQTGAGKSSIGNTILANPKAFLPAPIGSPESMTTAIHSSQTTHDGCHIYVFDTPGLGDTHGRSIEFLDHIMRSIKKEAPHGLIFFINGGDKITPFVKFALRCFAECLKPSVESGLGMPHGRVLLVVNHLPSNGDFSGPFAQNRLSKQQVQEALAATMDKANDSLAENLKTPMKVPCAHTFGIQKNDENLDHTMERIVAAIKNLPDTPLDVGQFRTFADVMKEAHELNSEKIEAAEYADRKIKQLKYDIGWHESRIRDCTIANASTCWIPFANIATTIGFVAAIADSNSKIPGLNRELAEVQNNKVHVLEVAKTRAKAWLKEMDDLQTAMSSA